jgi:excisionase family DNA binding protein
MKSSHVFDSKGQRRRYLSVKQVAQMLNVHVHTLRRYIRAGKIKAYQPLPNCTRIPEEEVERLLSTTNISKGVKQ